MSQEWTAEVVARLHLAKIPIKQLAREAGYTPEYVSMVLNGHRATEKSKIAILAALDRLTEGHTPQEGGPTPGTEGQEPGAESSEARDQAQDNA